MLASVLLHLSVASLLALVGCLVIAGATKGLIGIGMPIVAVPLLNLVVDLPATVALLSIPLVISNIPQAFDGEPVGVVLRRLSSLLAGLAGGVVIGVMLLTTVSSSALKPWVGVMLIATVLLMLIAPRFTVPERLRPIAGPFAGLIGGILGGLAALPGPFVFVYLLALGITRDQFVQYSSMFLVVAASAIVVAMGGMGNFNGIDMVVSALAVLPIFLGMWFGRHLRDRLSGDVFRKVILGVVMVSGLNLIGKPDMHWFWTNTHAAPLQQTLPLAGHVARN
jgi:uncharacterized membrane protein YfcA